MTRTVNIIGAPVDYGANRRGVDMGPSAIRYAGLEDLLADGGNDAVDAGDLLVPRAEERDPDAASDLPGTTQFLDEVEDLSRRLADETADVLAAGSFPLVLGGDHSIAIGTLNGAARDADVGAIWFDAHGDFNTPATSPSGNVHGMPLAAVLGLDAFGDTDWAPAPGLREENLVLVGLRSLDPAEREAIRASDATAYTMSDVDERSMASVVEDAIDVATRGVDGIHVSLDLDWLDPDHAPGVGTPVRGGVTYREAHTALEAVADRDEEHGILRSMDVVEVNPVIDSENRTGELAAELAASALGKRIM